MSDVSSYLLTALCAFVVYPIVYGKVVPYMLKMIVCRRYTSLDKARQKYAQMIAASLVYTSVVSPCALLVHHFDQDLALAAKNSVLRYDSPNVRHLLAIVLGYTAGEFLVTLVDVGRSGISLFGFTAHHAITCYCALVGGCIYPRLPVFANLLTVTELSTIFLDVRLLLNEFGIPKSSTIYWCNNIAFFLSFSYVRVWLLVFRVYIPFTSVLMTKEFYELEWSVVVAFVCGAHFFVVINLYWYVLMCRRLPRAISGYEKDSID